MPLNTNKIEEVKVNVYNGQRTGITGAIGGLFWYFSSAMKSTTQYVEYVGINIHLETAKNKIIMKQWNVMGLVKLLKIHHQKWLGLLKEQESIFIIKVK